MARGKPYSPEQRQEALRLVGEVGVVEAARQLSIHPSTLKRWRASQSGTAAPVRVTRQLSLKQKAFVEEYVRNGGNGVRAALEVYDTEDYGTARVIASKNMTKANIQAYRDELMAQFAMGKDEVVFRIAQLARGDIGDFLGDGDLVDLDKARRAHRLHLLKEVTQRVTVVDGEESSHTVTETRIKLHDPHVALEKLAKILGLYVDKTEHSVAPGATIEIKIGGEG